MHGLEAEYWDRVDFVYLDIDDPANQGVMQEFRFTAQPLFVLVSADRQQIQRWSGYQSADALSDGLDGYLETLASGG